MNITVIQTAAISAATVENHIPSSPQMSGNNITAAIWNTRVRINEIAADTVPLFSAVKNDEPNIAKPENTKTNEYIRNACRVISSSP